MSTKSSKSDSKSEIDTILNNVPDPTVTALDAVTKYLDRCWGIYKKGSHDAFLVAWNAGSILSYYRKQASHGNSREVKDGTGQTFADWVESNCKSIVLETANRWADLWEWIKPESCNDWDSLTITEALEIARVRKGERGRAAKRNDKVEQETEEKKQTTTPIKAETPPLGNAIRSTRRAVEKLYQVAENEDFSASNLSTAIQIDNVSATITDCLICIQQLWETASILADKSKGKLGDAHYLTSKSLDKIKQEKDKFLTLHKQLLGLTNA
jgi:hypothetical protein